MIKPKILVTAAAGRTGAAAVTQLLGKGFPVRAFVRRRDHRSEILERAGAELFVGDMFDFRDLRKALHGVQRAYHCPPFAPNLLHNSMLFALAAEEAKLEVVALLSGWNPHAAHPSVLTREHWIANNLYRWMPSVDVIHINPGLFAFVYLLGLPAIVHFGMLAGPFGDGSNAPPSNEDIASVAVGALSDPAPHIGKCYRPTGPELLTAHDIAAILTGVVGRKVKYQNVPERMFVKAAIAQGFPLFETSQVRHYLAELRQGAFAVGAPTDHVQEVGMRTPENFESIARRYVKQLSLIHSHLSIGTRLGALGFMLRMLGTRVPDLDGWERNRDHPLLTQPILAQDSEEWRVAAEERMLHLLR
ncbi:MAG: NmrA family NAD(P)-binding protein [Rhodoferax sp.]|nr:NmrA family NAD(P)-binding protein [Rhodoferax sp.]